MTLLSLVTAPDIQQQFAESVRALRKSKKLSRKALAAMSTVPEATIKKFETTGQISLRQFLLLWQSLADLNSFAELARQAETRLKQSQPHSIDDVLRS
ncbi:MAG: transcriptional regulator [Kistimonas sp.]|nr:transcriptional regulator [Kistimonas sp.]